MYDNDEDLIEEPVHSYTTEVRDLFSASIVTDLRLEHTDECDERRAYAERNVFTARCGCASTSYYYVGRRADPEMGTPPEYIAGPCLSLDELETLCRDRIDQYRVAAKRNAR